MVAAPLARAAGLVALLALSACSDSTAPDDDPGGAFTAELSGVLDATLSGHATSAGAPETTWTLTLVTPGGAESISLVTRDGLGRPALGDYPLVDFTTGQGGSGTDDYLIAAVQLAPDAFPGYVGFDFLAGTLTITVSTPSEVAGTFQLGTSVTGDPTRILVVTGAFTSTHQETGS